jgi:hypothetical protein
MSGITTAKQTYLVSPPAKKRVWYHHEQTNVSGITTVKQTCLVSPPPNKRVWYHHEQKNVSGITMSKQTCLVSPPANKRVWYHHRQRNMSGITTAKQTYLVSPPAKKRVWYHHRQTNVCGITTGKETCVVSPPPNQLALCSPLLGQQCSGWQVCAAPSAVTHTHTHTHTPAACRVVGMSSTARTPKFSNTLSTSGGSIPSLTHHITHRKEWTTKGAPHMDTSWTLDP